MRITMLAERAPRLAIPPHLDPDALVYCTRHHRQEPRYQRDAENREAAAAWSAEYFAYAAQCPDTWRYATGKAVR